MYCLCTAIFFDAIIWLGLRRADVNHAVADRFALINISLLTLDAAITLASFYRTALRKRWVIACLVILENVTFIVWVQATGTLSSYFVLAGAILILAYRLAFDFAVAATCAASLFVMHIGVIVLELSGVLTPEPLFHGPVSRVYELPLYQSMTIISIGSIYVLCFVGANAYVNKLREKEHALREVREEAAEIAEGARHGRLSGMVIADEYALGELLGRGGMGEIYIARRVSAEQTVAVKVLHPHLIESATALERFRREARAAERIPAAHTARILAVGSDDDQGLHYIVMEYLRGEDMGALLRRRGPLRVRELVPIARQIAEALDAAHAVGVVHRDLKPSNVFLLAGATGDIPEVRLLDFGISKMLDDTDEDPLTRADAVLGTIGYMAPEQALSQLGEVGPASDRFSFAAVIYRALCGRVPFLGRDVASAVQSLLRSAPPPPSTLRPGLPPDVDMVMTIGMAKTPGSRYSTAKALVDHLEIAADGCLDTETRERANLLTMPTSTLTAPPDDA